MARARPDQGQARHSRSRERGRPVRHSGDALSGLHPRHARLDPRGHGRAGLKPKAAQLLSLLEKDAFATPPRYEKLVGDLSGAYSRRINIQHRLVYQVIEDKKVVKVLRMWSHYE
ncbi:MAG: Txe/YoeB family addiction module toxin [Coriobacteriia bacterium]|nr:Txe/YoeB family addiction module toxin [Coriobacteriia bacterium]